MTRGWKITLGIFAAIVVVNVGTRLLNSVTGGSPGGPTSSTYATGADGLAGYFSLLAADGHQVGRVRTLPARTALSADATAVVLDPVFVNRGDAEALRSFVERGGRLLVGGGADSALWLRGLLRPAPTWSTTGVTRAALLAPVPELAGAARLRSGGNGSWRNTGAALGAYGAAGRSLVAVASLGLGRVILLADASPLQDRYLGLADNARFGLAAAGAATAAGRVLRELPRLRPGKRLRQHSEARGTSCSAGLVLAALALMVARGRRLGPPELESRELPPPRRAYVDSLAGIMARAKRPDEALEPVRAEARARLARRVGLAPGCPAAGARGRRAASSACRRRRSMRCWAGPAAATDPGRRARARSCGQNRREERRMKSLRDRVVGEVGKVVVGQDDVVEGLVAALLVGGHVLLEGVPGVAKTLVANATARALGLDFRRVQFTPDMLPSDLTGTMVLRGGELAFRPGPVFTSVLLADEINRTPPKTQAALLEAMQERQVTVDGVARPLPDPFLVIGTQNPIEYEGTYPLPEAQLDRFLLRLDVGYPDAGAARSRILRLPLRGMLPARLEQIQPVVDRAELLEARRDRRRHRRLGRGGRIRRRRSCARPGSCRASSSARARARQSTCSPPRGPTHASTSAASSRPTTSSPSRRPCSVTGCCCGPKPSSSGTGPTTRCVPRSTRSPFRGDASRRERRWRSPVLPLLALILPLGVVALLLAALAAAVAVDAAARAADARRGTVAAADRRARRSRRRCAST